MRVLSLVAGRVREHQAASAMRAHGRHDGGAPHADAGVLDWPVPHGGGLHLRGHVLRGLPALRVPRRVARKRGSEPRWRTVRALEPTDRNAQFLILEGLLIEAQVGREGVEETRQSGGPRDPVQILERSISMYQEQFEAAFKTSEICI